jgi:hypothetical protein
VSDQEDQGSGSGSDSEGRADHGTDPDGSGDWGATDRDTDLPAETIEEAERLTRLAREAGASEEREAHRERRAEVVAEYGYTARVREEDTGEVLVLHPAEWIEDGLVRTDRIEELDRAVERPLSGPGDPEEWDAIEAHNRSIVSRVAETAGPVHGANAEAFADFMGNHYARPVESANDPEIEEFLTEYFPRNAWPSAEQKEVVEESIDLLVDLASEDSSREEGDGGSDPEASTTDTTDTDDASDSEGRN